MVCNNFWRSVILTVALVPFASGCATVPFDYPREDSVAIAPDEDTALRRMVESWGAVNPGPSGFYPLVSGQDAFGARLRMIELAQKSIDVQYFLMKGDMAGRVFAGSLLLAADRGVRIRFLLDDVFTEIEDEELELLAEHPNIELRLFNPIARRGIDLFNFIFDFRRANRRMHNKSFTVDNQVTIVGGRNIADEYFGLRPEGEFLDLDVIGAGPIAAEVSANFDRYWNNSRSLPVEALASQFEEQDLARVRAEIDEAFRSKTETVYEQAVSSKLVHELLDGRRALYSANGEVITDSPEKITSEISAEQMVLVQRLQEAIAAAKEEVLVFTPYFVPGKNGVAFWKSIVDSGVRVTIITNSLASNNHTSVHAGYAKYRKRLIKAGVELYEARANATAGNAKALTLHTKAMIIDRTNVFIGSPNLDPRSIRINSEMGLLIPNQQMGEALADAALEQLNSIAYRVELDERGRLQWRATIDSVEVIEKAEPLSSRWRRLQAFFLRVVPDSQL